MFQRILSVVGSRLHRSGQYPSPLERYTARIAYRLSGWRLPAGSRKAFNDASDVVIEGASIYPITAARPCPFREARIRQISQSADDLDRFAQLIVLSFSECVRRDFH